MKPFSKRSHVLLTIFGSIYITAVFCAKPMFALLYDDVKLQASTAWGVYLLVIVIGLSLSYCLLDWLSRHIHALFSYSRECGRFSPALFLVVADVMLILLLSKPRADQNETCKLPGSILY